MDFKVWRVAAIHFFGWASSHLSTATIKLTACAIAGFTSATKANLLIQSAGGAVGDGIAIYNYLRYLPIEIVTYNAGAVESIAVLPYLAGRIRRASRHAVFMLHKTVWPNPAPLGAMELSIRAEASRLHDANVEAILRSEISLPDEKWTTHNTSDLVIGAPDAVDYRLVHEIADFRPPHGAPLINIWPIVA
jgi:ATP-dependent Clp protease protease subunit